MTPGFQAAVSRLEGQRRNLFRRSRPFPSDDASETPQERLNVSETSSDGKDHDTLVEQ